MKTSNSEALRQALGQFATGVTIVTTAGADGEPIGVTANSFNSVSLNPPLVLWSLATAAHSRKSFQSATYFCVHVLAASQETLSQTFAAKGANKFGDIKFVRGLGSAPLLEDFVARFQCRQTHQYPVGDHIVFVGEVLKFDKSDRRPLVFHGGRYALADRRMLKEFARRLDETETRVGDRRTRRKTPP